MNTTILTGILLVIIGAYAMVRGLAMGKPMAFRTTFTEIAFGLVGAIGFYAVALGWFLIVLNYNMGMGA